MKELGYQSSRPWITVQGHLLRDAYRGHGGVYSFWFGRDPVGNQSAILLVTLRGKAPKDVGRHPISPTTLSLRKLCRQQGGDTSLLSQRQVFRL